MFNPVVALTLFVSVIGCGYDRDSDLDPKLINKIATVRKGMKEDEVLATLGTAPKVSRYTTLLASLHSLVSIDLSGREYAVTKKGGKTVGSWIEYREDGRIHEKLMIETADGVAIEFPGETALVGYVGIDESNSVAPYILAWPVFSDSELSGVTTLRFTHLTVMSPDDKYVRQSR